MSKRCISPKMGREHVELICMKRNSLFLTWPPFNRKHKPWQRGVWKLSTLKHPLGTTLLQENSSNLIEINVIDFHANTDMILEAIAIAVEEASVFFLLDAWKVASTGPGWPLGCRALASGVWIGQLLYPIVAAAVHAKICTYSLQYKGHAFESRPRHG